jgi:hypothetical protein
MPATRYIRRPVGAVPILAALFVLSTPTHAATV